MAIRTRFTHRPRCIVFPAFVLWAIASLWTRPAHAQWTVVKSFGVQVRSVYFLDQQGAATTGFAGLANSTIWRTTDNGKTWNRMATPYIASPMQVTAFAFSNKLLGWCSLRTFSGEWGEIWKTTNGGTTWDSVYSGGAFSSVAYCAATGILVAPCWSDTAIYQPVLSKDSGTTWQAFAPEGLNGATFSGSDGVIGNILSLNPLYTGDGGVSWSAPLSTSFDTVETWAPHAIPGTTTFVAAAEKTRQFFLSTDGGASWMVKYTFPVNPQLTGCIMGTLARMLFVQTEYHGFSFSSDTGKSRTSICGPDNALDTRFYAIGKAVFAGDLYGNMWYSPDATVNANPVFGLENTSLSFSGIRCATYDSVLYFYYGAGCDTAVLTKAQIVTGASAFSTVPLQFPAFFSGIDSLTILYTPSLALRDSGTLLLEFDLGTRLVDTVIHLYGTGRSAAKFSQVDSLIISNPYACTANDTSIVLQNLSCDTLTITSATLTGKPIFQLVPLKLPYKIAPLDSVVIQITAASPNDGVFKSSLFLSMLAGGGVRSTDTIPIILGVLQGAQARFGALDLSVLDACTVIDTVFSITNTPCNAITVLGATLSDSSVFHLDALTFPISIKPSGVLNLPLHIAPGSKGMDTTRLHLHYTSGNAVIDTTITLTTQVRYDLPLHVDLADSAFDLGSVGVPCAIASRWITFHNGLCRDLIIKRISWVGSNSQFSFDPTSLPDTLASDTGMGSPHDADSVLVHFSPTSVGTASNQLRVTLDMNGTQFDTVITISGSGIQAYRDSVLTHVLQYDSVVQCLSTERDGEVVDLTCDSVTVVSAVVLGSLGYSVIGPAFPMSLSYGDTLHVRFLLQPKQIGPAADRAILTLHDLRNDRYYTDTIALTGYVLAGRHALELNSSSFLVSTIAPCSVLDSFLVITNRGCDNVIIEDTSLVGYLGIQLLPGFSLPLTIAPDSSIRIPFQILPNRDSLESSLLSLRGQNIDISINFTYAALPGSASLTLSVPDSVFVTRPCVPVSKTFWIANTGCEPDTLNTLALVGLPGASQFTVQNPPSLPAILSVGDTLHFIIQFDPNGNGNGLATLDIKSVGAQFSQSIALTGSVNGTVPMARIALEATDGSNQCSGMASNLTSIVAKLLDDVGDSTALSTVAITLHANWDLLTPLNFSPAPGWSVLDTSTLSNGDFQIRIHHDAAGAVPAGTALITTSFYIAVSDSTRCDIVLSNVRFNDSAANYEDCVLSSIAMPDPIHFTEMDTCGTPELRGSMGGRLALKIISVIPNPASVEGGAARMNVTFELARAGNVRIVVRDLLGREYVNAVQSFAAGTHTVVLNLSNATEGTYFVQLESGSQTAEAKVIVQNAGANLAK